MDVQRHPGANEEAKTIHKSNFNVTRKSEKYGKVNMDIKTETEFRFLLDSTSLPLM